MGHGYPSRFCAWVLNMLGRRFSRLHSSGTVAFATPGPRALHRGFTLTELMVAMSGGLFLSTVVFVLARDSTRFYQRETRVANANLSEIIGFQRLSADIARAGYLSTPNIRRDQSLCGDPVGEANTWPAELAELSSLRVLDEDAPGGRQVHGLQLSGAYTSADQFPVRVVTPGQSAGTAVVFLQVNTGPMARLGYPTGGAEPQQTAALSRVFSVGRILRLVDQAGHVHFGTITQVSGGAEPSISLGATPPIRFRSSGSLCGFRGFETGALANVVNIIRYQMDSTANATKYPEFARLHQFASTGEATKEANRRDLIRYEIYGNGDVVPNTTELIAEYAVDLRVGLTVINNGSFETPSLTTLLANQAATPTVNDTGIFDWAGAPSTLDANQGPEYIRSVRARLSVRSREPDRATDITESTTVAPGLYRIGLADDGGAPFARVRTLQADIALRNQMR